MFLFFNSLLGEAAVGKSSLVLRFVENSFTENGEPTIGGLSFLLNHFFFLFSFFFFLLLRPFVLFLFFFFFFFFFSSRLSDPEVRGWRQDDQVWDLGHGRTGEVPQPGPHVLQKCSGRHCCLWHHQHSKDLVPISLCLSLPFPWHIHPLKDNFIGVETLEDVQLLPVIWPPFLFFFFFFFFLVCLSLPVWRTPSTRASRGLRSSRGRRTPTSWSHWRETRWTWKPSARSRQRRPSRTRRRQASRFTRRRPSWARTWRRSSLSWVSAGGPFLFSLLSHAGDRPNNFFFLPAQKIPMDQIGGKKRSDTAVDVTKDQPPPQNGGGCSCWARRLVSFKLWLLFFFFWCFRVLLDFYVCQKRKVFPFVVCVRVCLCACVRRWQQQQQRNQTERKLSLFTSPDPTFSSCEVFSFFFSPRPLTTLKGKELLRTG